MLDRASGAVLGIATIMSLGGMSLWGCGEREDFSRRPPFLAASTDIIDFGERFIGAEEQRTLFLINKGDTPVTLESATGDTLGGIFAILLGDTEIEPGKDVVARVVFTAADPIDYNTTITFPNDSDNQPNFQVRLLGRGVEPDPCYQVQCDAPYPPQCLSSTESRVFALPGTCDESDGLCDYTFIDETCEFGCDATTGRCDGDPCQGVVCQSPPNDCYEGTGVCAGGSCIYLPNDGAVCDDGQPCTDADTCDNGVCRGTPKLCDNPPGDSCTDSQTRRIWDPQGVCDNSGTCRYQSHDVACQFGCSAQDCMADPCTVLNCNDGNPCTIDSCTPGVGCRHDPNDGAICPTGSGDCPQGLCQGQTCVVQTGTICTAEVDVDLCNDVEVPGICTSNGDCVVEEVPPQFTCPGCPGICLQCYFIQLCIPL